MLTMIRPVGGDRGEFVTNCVPERVRRVLDVGCSYGWMLGALAGKADELWGIDMDAEALAIARASYPGFHFVHQTAASLPFPDESFDVVILSEVIEHVGDENKVFVVDEICRVLRNGGNLIFTAPYAGWFAWLDPMDFKRRFPAVYRLYMRLSGYHPATAIEIGHKHVSLEEVQTLFRGRFVIQRLRYCGLLMPVLTWLLTVGKRLRLLPKRVEDAINRFRGWESGIQYGRHLSFNIRLAARKQIVERSDRTNELVAVSDACA